VQRWLFSNNLNGRTDGESVRILSVDEGRKRVLAIVAGILVARHLKSTEDLFDNRPSPRTEAMVAAAVQWAERIMRKIDSVFGSAT
jgi:NADH:ubiquinone oxidoreductase subunit B-like Fe-S oxidoreductase